VVEPSGESRVCRNHILQCVVLTRAVDAALLDQRRGHLLPTLVKVLVVMYLYVCNPVEFR
jgi:hypothetical protein